jgi:pilus assembly protein Flp/PilA
MKEGGERHQGFLASHKTSAVSHSSSSLKVRRTTMSIIVNLLNKLFRNQDGQTLAEYALILVLVAIVAIIALTALGVNIAGVLTNIAGAI